MSEYFQNDLILVEKAQKGDQNALNELIRKYQDQALFLDPSAVWLAVLLDAV